MPAFSTMKRLFVFFSLLSCVGGSAQDMKNFYRQAGHDEGTLYFVLPREMACCGAKPGGFSGSLSYDYTYLDARDSVTMLMTVATDGIFEADSVCFETVQGAFGFGVEPIFRMAGKREWQSRLRCVVPYGLWGRCIAPPNRSCCGSFLRKAVRVCGFPIKERYGKRSVRISENCRRRSVSTGSKRSDRGTVFRLTGPAVLLRRGCPVGRTAFAGRCLRLVGGTLSAFGGRVFFFGRSAVAGGGRGSVLS